MFSFDQAALPQLTTRKALILVDFQTDFISPEGALPVSEPNGFVDRSLKLVEAFRANGDIVWVQSAFEAPRPADPERILATDDKVKVRRSASSRTRRKNAEEEAGDEPTGPPDTEAFLSHEEPTCVNAGSPGYELAPQIQDAVRKEDLKLTKTHYSAFEGSALLRMLRAKMVIEVFICGSLTNIGVYATAMGAAGHGMSITIVDDCCGYRSESRQIAAINNIVELTGCETASCDEVIQSLNPKPRKRSSEKKSQKSPTVETTSKQSTSGDLVSSMTSLSLGPQPGTTEEESASRAERSDPPSHSEPQNGTSSVADDKESITAETQVPESQTPVTTVDSAEDGAVSGTVKAKTSAGRRSSIAESDLDGASNGKHNNMQQRGLCEGDTDVIEDLLPDTLEGGIFDRLRDEVEWKRMSHQGGEVPRLVAVQGDVSDDGSMPVYRHPSDESPPLLPFSKTVLEIKAETEKRLGHPLNHVLIQYYRDGNDYISEHSDKTLDITRGSYIANVSLGAERTMVLRTKRQDKDRSKSDQHQKHPPPPKEQHQEKTTSEDGAKRKIQRARLPHNSLCRMGLDTNMKWLHAIRQDKRADRIKSAEELAFAGGRISLTFRRIGTFLSQDETLIWGQGAVGKTRADARSVINGQTVEAIQMLRAFGTENHSSSFDWDAHYGKGFDVLHIRAAPRFFASADPIINMRIGLALAEKGIGFAKGSMGTPQANPSADGDSRSSDARRVKFIDNDTTKSTVEGELAILLYLDARNRSPNSGSQAVLALRYTRFQQGLDLLDRWRRLSAKSTTQPPSSKALRQELGPWDACLTEGGGASFLAGDAPSLPDFAVWPVLHAIVEECGAEALASMDALRRYYERIMERESAQKVLGRTTKSEES